jgi:hypothetical protein
MQVLLDVVSGCRQRTPVDIVRKQHGGQQEHDRTTGSPRAILGMGCNRDQVAGAGEFM